MKTIKFPNDTETYEIVDETARKDIEDLRQNITIEETDPTVPEWAKEPNKPTYTAEEVGALPNTTVIPSITGLATETYVDQKVAGIVDSAPETLNTLNELATALGDDPNFATTIATEIGSKANAQHTHTKSEITDFPISMPASDVYGWAKASTKPNYTAEEVGARPNTWTPTPAEIGAAPVGYGLGSTNAMKGGSYSANDYTKNGYYSAYNGTPTTGVWWRIHVDSSWESSGNTCCHQIAYRYDDTTLIPIQAERMLLSDGWTPWEYVNPPMVQGVEYRTTERIASKAVYKKNDNGVIKYRLDGETEWKDINSIGGNAVSATKATQDGNGNQIDTSYVKRNNTGRTSIRVSSATDTALDLYSGNEGASYIGFLDSKGTYQGFVGASGGVPVFSVGSDKQTIITSSSIGSQSVASATKATQDASGNTITSTYATKTELDKKVDKQSANKAVYSGSIASYYSSSSTPTYYRIKLPETSSSVWTMLNLEISVRQTYSDTTGGKILINAYHSNGGNWSKINATTIGNLTSAIKVYGSDIGKYLYIAGCGQYSTISIDKILVGDSAISSVDFTSTTIDIVSALPTSYQDATMNYGIHSGNISSQSVASATKATQDGNGNNIVNTYATKAELAAGGSVAANKITAGTFATTDIKAANGTDYSTARIRNIYAGTTDMTAGSSTLANGCMYLVYEE